MRTHVFVNEVTIGLHVHVKPAEAAGQHRVSLIVSMWHLYQ